MSQYDKYVIEPVFNGWIVEVIAYHEDGAAKDVYVFTDVEKMQASINNWLLTDAPIEPFAAETPEPAPAKWMNDKALAKLIRYTRGIGHLTEAFLWDRSADGDPYWRALYDLGSDPTFAELPPEDQDKILGYLTDHGVNMDTIPLDESGTLAEPEASPDVPPAVLIDGEGIEELTPEEAVKAVFDVASAVGIASFDLAAMRAEGQEPVTAVDDTDAEVALVWTTRYSPDLAEFWIDLDGRPYACYFMGDESEVERYRRACDVLAIAPLVIPPQAEPADEIDGMIAAIEERTTAPVEG